MSQTKITIPSTFNPTTIQRDYLTKIGFAISGGLYIKSVNAVDVPTVVAELSRHKIQFSLQAGLTGIQNARPCGGCKT